MKLMNTQPQIPQTPKKSTGCLQVFLIFAGIIILLCLIFGILIWQSYSWFANCPEPVAANYPPITLLPAEQEEMKGIAGQL